MTDPYPGTDRYVANKYFAFAQYTRHIRPGMLIIDSADPVTVAAYDPARHRLVLVTVLGNTPAHVTYDLTRLRAVGQAARCWVTDAHSNYRIARQYKRLPNAPLNGKRLSISLAAESIQTIEIDNVRL